MGRATLAAWLGTVTSLTPMRRHRSGCSCSTTTRSSGAASRSCSRASPTSWWSGSPGLADEATRRIPALRPDVAILDARLPDGSGIDVCREIRSRDPHIKALILTSYDDDEALFAAIMAGAAGYTLKQVRGNDLVDAVRRVAAGQSMLDPSVTAAGARPGPQRSAGGQGAGAAHRAGAADPGPDR